MTKRSTFDSNFTASVADCKAGSATWIEACWNDMRDRAQAGESYDAKQYVEMIPNPSVEQIADLVYGEFVTSRESGKMVSAQQYLTKYPDIAEQLARQFSIDEALSEIDDHATDFSDETQAANRTLTIDLVESLRQPKCQSSIGRYAIVDALKHGAQAEVYRAYDPTLKRDVVIKIEAKSGPTKRKMFSDTEAIISANLNHPNISPALDAGTHHGRKYSVSRFLRGRTFDQWVRDSKPNPHLVAKTISKIARGLASAHQCGVLHLDVKPQNIIVDENQEPYLIDFGLSVASDAHTTDSMEEGVIRGTPQFMAPEQIKGDVDQIGPCTDIFGLGATLFRGWVGRPPYDAPSSRIELTSIQQGRWHTEWLDEAGLTDEMRSIISRAMAEAPKDRFASCIDFADTLERVAADSESVNGTEDRKKTGQWKGWATVAAAIVLLFWIASVLYPDPTSVEPTTHAVSLPSLEILIARESDRFVELTNRVPLMSGDKIRLKGFIPANQTALIVGIAPDGNSQVLARFGMQDHARIIQHPSDPGKAIPLVGSGGTEVVAIVIGDSGDALDRVVTELERHQKPWPMIPETAVLAWHNHQLVQSMPTGGDADAPREMLAGNSRNLGSEIEINSAFSRISVQFSNLEARLSALSDHEKIVIKAIAFRHLGNDSQ